MFASDRVSIFPGDLTNAGFPTFAQDGEENAGVPLLMSGGNLHGHHESHAFHAQAPVVIMPAWGNRPGDQRNPHEAAPGGMVGVDRGELARKQWNNPIRVAKALYDRFTKRTHVDGPLTGSAYTYADDPEQTGTMIPPVQLGAADTFSQGTDVFAADSMVVTRVPDTGANGEPLQQDILEHVQSRNSAKFQALRSLVASYTNMRVIPIPQTRTIVLTLANTALDMTIPDSAVTMRVTWSNSQATSLFMSFGGLAAQPGANTGDNIQSQNDGLIINPDQSANYFVKGKKQVSFLSTAPGVFVNAQFYMNN